VTHDVARLVEFFKQAFAATGDLRKDRPCEIRIGDSLVMVSEAGVREAMPAFLYLYVDETDATYERALKAGAESLAEPQDMPYGDRRCMVKDQEATPGKSPLITRKPSGSSYASALLATRRRCG